MATSGTIDRATAVMVPAVLASPTPEPKFRWGIEGALAFSILSLFTSHTTFAANPSPDKRVSGLFGEFLSGALSYTLPEQRATARAEREAILATKNRCSDATAILHALNSIKLNPSYPWWLDYHAQHQLVDHASRLGGLVDPQFSEHVSTVLGLPNSEILRIIEITREVGNVASLSERLAKGKCTDSDNQILDAWLASTLLRGVYHDEIARVRRRQHHRHPLRCYLGANGHSVSSGSLFEPNPAQETFAAILLGITFSATKEPINRIRLFNSNMASAKRALSTGGLSLADSATGMTVESGRERAVSEARQLVKSGHLDAGGRMESAAIDASIGLTAVGIGFALSPWLAVAVGAGATIAQVIGRPGQELATRRRASRHNLLKLADAAAGAVDIKSK